MLVVAPLSARSTERIGTKLVVGAGLSFATLALVADQHLAGHRHQLPARRACRAWCSWRIGMGLAMAPATESIMGSLPRAKAGVGSAMNDTTRQVGGALGVAVVGSVMLSVYSDRAGAALDEPRTYR